MFETIIIGVDGGSGGADALAVARRLAGPATNLIAVSVAELDRRLTRAANADYDRTLREDAHARLEASLDGQHGITGQVVAASSVAEGLHDAAIQHVADLIVVGRGARAGLDRVLEGDDALSTLRDAPCAVAVAPPGSAQHDEAIKVVGVGWDGRPEGHAALDLARSIAGDRHAHVRAHEVVGFGGTPDTGATLHREIDTFVGDDEDVPVAMEGVEGTTSTGMAAQLLQTFADEVDVLVVGSRGRGRFARVALGSTAESLARHVNTPLIIVPRTSQPAVPSS